jgi:NADH-quinone oxidoreductase subunit L
MFLSAGLGLAGIWAAYVVYVKKEGLPAERFVARFKALYRLVSRKYFVDEIYDRVAVRGTLALGRLSAWFDARVIDGLVDGSSWLVRKFSSASMAFDKEVVDGAVNGIGRIHRAVSRGLRRLQTGYVYNYALAIVIGLVILVSLAMTIF